MVCCYRYSLGLGESLAKLCYVVSVHHNGVESKGLKAFLVNLG
jgi:hypothetical protein